VSWKPYDPGWLVELAREQHPEVVWLSDALVDCTSYGEESPAYYYFVEPSFPNQPGSEWQFACNVVLHHEREGEIVLDVLRGDRIGGVEFIERV